MEKQVKICLTILAIGSGVCFVLAFLAKNSVLTTAFSAISVFGFLLFGIALGIINTAEKYDDKIKNMAEELEEYRKNQIQAKP